MNAVYQHPKDLTFALFKGEPQFPMTLIRSRRLNFGRYDIHMHIIGESHAVIQSLDSIPFQSEVLACYPIPEEKCIYRHTFRQLDNHSIHCGDYGSEIAINIPTWDIPIPIAENTIQVAFPSIYGQTPITRVQWMYEENQVIWWTLHMYPLKTETISVYTRSHIKLIQSEGI